MKHKIFRVFTRLREGFINIMEKTLKIENKTGLHARPASMFVQEANKFQSKIKISAKGKTVDAKSILMIMSLGLTQGTELTISAEGPDEADALAALSKLIEDKFGEAE